MSYEAPGKPHKFEMGERVQVIPGMVNTLPPSQRGTIVRRYVHSISGEPEYVVRFDSDANPSNDWDVPQSYLQKETTTTEENK
ncbi:MAG TPA: hypothetical protein VF867_14355 [Arthrobacter sp.]